MLRSVSTCSSTFTVRCAHSTGSNGRCGLEPCSFFTRRLGKILTDRASAIKTIPYKGANYFAITAAFNNAINRVSVDKTHSPKDSWDMFVAELGTLK